MPGISNQNKAVVLAYTKGYRVINGEVISPYSKKPRVLEVFVTKSGVSYYRFSVRINKNKTRTVRVHRLVAYQKYGNLLFETNKEVRHLDGNSLNNMPNNIALGSRSENNLDKKPEIILRSVITASTAIRKFSDKKMKEIKIFHDGSYKETMKKFNISSKGTLHRILNVTYVTKK